MFDFTNRLLLNKHFKMDKGKISVFKQEGIMIPVTILSGLLKVFEERNAIRLYNASKKGGIDRIKQMKQDYGNMSNEELIMWGSRLVTFAGWGELNVVSVKPKNIVITYEVKDSALTETREKTNKAIDHILRGLLAGGLSQGFGSSMEAIETQCKAKGNPICQIIVKEKNTFDKNHPLYKEQVGEN
ncbi:MAG: V4R domain-containing protein [archaeon]